MITFGRGTNFIKEIPFNNPDFEMAKNLVKEIFKIISRGYYPKKASSLAHCIDCCYKNICV